MSLRELTNTEAMVEALKEEMTKDPSVFIIGEDLVAHGGIFRSIHWIASGLSRQGD